MTLNCTTKWDFILCLFQIHWSMCDAWLLTSMHAWISVSMPTWFTLRMKIFCLYSNINAIMSDLMDDDLWFLKILMMKFHKFQRIYVLLRSNLTSKLIFIKLQLMVDSLRSFLAQVYENFLNIFTIFLCIILCTFILVIHISSQFFSNFFFYFELLFHCL